MPKHVEWEKFKRRFINSLPMYMGMLSGVGFTISLAAMLSGLPVSSFGGWLLTGVVSFYAAHTISMLQRVEIEQLLTLVDLLSTKEKLEGDDSNEP